MTRYHGGKQRVASSFAPFIEDKLSGASTYCEPFCGMLSIFHSLSDSSLAGKQICVSDYNAQVVDMWDKLVKREWEPPHTVDKQTYEAIKDGSLQVDPATRCYIGHQYSFGGVAFRTYSPLKDSTRVRKRILHIADKLRHYDAKIWHCDYTEMNHLTNTVIYCDPPYAQTNCQFQSRFDHEHFWQWCQGMANQNNHVFVSEYTAPEWAEMLYVHPKRNFLRGRIAKDFEKLFYLAPSSQPMLEEEKGV